jgi:phosphoribosylamine-glycine ligase
VLTVVDVGDDLDDARFAAERGASQIAWLGMQRRHDIASDVPVPEGAAS